jgi:hypothetical protein
MLRRLGYRTKGHLQHCTSFRRGFHGRSTSSSTELRSSTSHRAQWCTKAYLSGSHHISSSSSPRIRATAEQENAIDDTMLGGVQARRDGTRTASRVGDRAATPARRGSAVADSVPRGLLVVSNAQRQKSTFSVKKLRKRLKPYRELLGRLVSVSGARRDKVPCCVIVLSCYRVIGRSGGPWYRVIG